LQRFFFQRGVTSTAANLAETISANSVQAAPAMLAKSVAAMALARGAAASTSTQPLIKGALKLMAWTKAKTTALACVGLLLAAGTTTVAVREIASHRHEVWQKKFDMTVLEKMPPQVKILPSLPSTLQSALHAAGQRYGKGLALGQSVPEIIARSYGVRPDRLLLATPVPKGQFDYIANLPEGNEEALRGQIEKQFGLVGRKELIETNVLVLTVQSRAAPGLKPAVGQHSGSQTDNSYSAQGQYIWSLVNYLERFLKVPVIDRTGLTGYYDIDFKWDSTPDGLKKVLLDELGLKLSPDRQNVEFVVVEKAK
jgi:uncharacterized protein (TIGR03435 family)